MPTQKPPQLSIICFGEALWDVLPRGIFLGGAPLNVAYHLSRFGVAAIPVSAVGRDFLGIEALRRIGEWGVPTRYIARLPRRPTGTVRATLDARGVASYRIVEGVAWDSIHVPRALRNASAPGAIVFGSLALRSVSNRRALGQLLEIFPKALRVLDLNLRAPFDRGAGVALALSLAQFVKLNDDELRRVTGARTSDERGLERAARRFADRHGVARVCVTAGPRGAGLLWEGQWFWEDGRTVRVRDTIGAGDSFLAGLLAALLLRKEEPGNALAKACRLGEFVAARDGATPPYRVDRAGRAIETSHLS